jgi:hypothetical protein
LLSAAISIFSAASSTSSSVSMILLNNTTSIMSYKQHNFLDTTSNTCGLRTITHTTNVENVAHLWWHILARHTNNLSQDSVTFQLLMSFAKAYSTCQMLLLLIKYKGPGRTQVVPSQLYIWYLATQAILLSESS